jgi:hypothetical protein
MTDREPGSRDQVFVSRLKSAAISISEASEVLLDDDFLANGLCLLKTSPDQDI